MLHWYTNVLSYPGKDIPSAAYVRKSILHGAADHVLRKVWICCILLDIEEIFWFFPLNSAASQFLPLNSDVFYLEPLNLFFSSKCTLSLS
jgi:hypothetical protein